LGGFFFINNSVTLFSSIFSKLLEEELLSLKEMSTWNSGLLTPNIGFKDPSQPTERHRKIIKDPGFRKHTQTVPDMHKGDPRSIQALEDLKTSATGRKSLTPTELQKVISMFHLVRMDPSTPKSLGNTGIILKFDPQLNGYILEK